MSFSLLYQVELGKISNMLLVNLLEYFPPKYSNPNVIGT